MANQILSNAGLWVGRYNLSCDATALSLGLSADMLDSTGVCGTARSRMGGLQTIAFQAEGMWQDAADAPLFEDVGFADVPVTIAPAGLAVADRAFLFRASQGDYQPVGGSVGEIARFSVGAEGTGVPAARGQLLANASAVTTTANGTAVQLGAVTAGQFLYATLHVTSAAGTSPTIAVKIQSDDNSGMSSPTDRLTFTTTSGLTTGTPVAHDQFGSVAGAITDTWWRVVYTITGTSPVFSFVVAAGIR